MGFTGNKKYRQPPGMHAALAEQEEGLTRRGSDDFSCRIFVLSFG
jgi:hypothetical protein